MANLDYRRVAIVGASVAALGAGLYSVLRRPAPVVAPSDVPASVIPPPAKGHYRAAGVWYRLLSWEEGWKASHGDDDVVPPLPPTDPWPDLIAAAITYFVELGFVPTASQVVNYFSVMAPNAGAPSSTTIQSVISGVRARLIEYPPPPPPDYYTYRTESACIRAGGIWGFYTPVAAPGTAVIQVQSLGCWPPGTPVTPVPPAPRDYSQYTNPTSCAAVGGVWGTNWIAPRMKMPQRTGCWSPGTRLVEDEQPPAQPPPSDTPRAVTDADLIQAAAYWIGQGHVPSPQEMFDYFAALNLAQAAGDAATVMSMVSQELGRAGIPNAPTATEIDACVHYFVALGRTSVTGDEIVEYFRQRGRSVNSIVIVQVQEGVIQATNPPSEVIPGPLVPGARPGSSTNPYNTPRQLTMTLQPGITVAQAVGFALGLNLTASGSGNDVVISGLTGMTASPTLQRLLRPDGKVYFATGTIS